MANYHRLIGVIGLALFLLQGPTTNAQAVIPTVPAVGQPLVQGDPASSLEQLQQLHASTNNAFVEMGELKELIDKEGGGPCASCAGLMTLQTLRVMSGMAPLPNPHQVVLKSIANQPTLLKGRVTNEEFSKLVAFYGQFLNDRGVNVEIVSAPNSPHASDGPRWAVTGPDLSIHARQLKILAYTVTTEMGEVRGRHFVLLKESRDGQIAVVDPSKPTKPRRYVIDEKRESPDTPPRVLLKFPPDVTPRPEVYELNTIFIVSLSLKNEAKATASPVESVDEVKARITQVASELRGTRDFRSPRAWREKTASFGLPGLDLPAELGGQQWPARKMIEVFRHAGRYDLNFRDVVGAAHGRALVASSHPEIQETVRRVARGQAYVAIAITEPEVGSDVPSIKSHARKVEGGFLLSGQKRFNARLDQATDVIIFTQGTTGKPGALSVFVLPLPTPGLVVEQLSAHGLTGNSYGGLSFKDLFVPEHRLIGTDGAGRNIFNDHFLYWRLMQAAAAIGTGEDALRQMAERLKTRQAFGGPIGRFTHLQQAIGQSTTELRMAFALAREAAEMIDRGDYKGARGIINGLKAEGVEMALRAVDSAARAFGGEGYSGLVDIGDRLRDLNGLRIADGTTDVMRMEVVRHAFGNEFWEMAVEKKD